MSKKLWLGFPRGEEEPGTPDTDGTRGSVNENCSTAGERPLDDVLDAGNVDPGGEGEEGRVLFVKPNVGRRAKDGYIGIL